MRSYHGSVAVGHFTRALGTGQHQPVAVLYAMWLQAADPFAEDVHVRLSITQLAGLVPSSARLRQIVAQLKDVGAIERAAAGFKLCKPDDTELDELARAQLDAAQRVSGGPKLPPQSKSTQLANETLVGLNKQRSDVRDVIAAMAGIKPNLLKFSGQGSLPVQSAIDWLAESGATWQQFVAVCSRASKDRSADRPKRIEYLFEYKADKRAYLERMLNTREQIAKPEAPQSTREEQQLDWLKENAMHATDAELPAIGNRLDCTAEVLDKYRTWRLQQETSPTSAT